MLYSTKTNLNHLSVYGVILDFAAKKQFLVEMEKSAAIMELYDAEFALASIFLLTLAKILPLFFYQLW